MSRLVRKCVTALTRFAREKRGATAVEFAIIAIPFMMLMFGVIEIGMVLLISATLDTAVEFAARNVRTGEFQQGGAVSKDDFKGLVCRNMTWLQGSCPARIIVESQTFDTYTNARDSTAAVAATFDPATPRCWSVGAPRDIVLMRVYYQWDLFTPMLNSSLENMGGGKRLIVSSSAFRNEPYDPNQDPVGAAC
ncbi:TadE/TadG family type IV pilus assembly protein [Phenylobacterium sp.]|uniref:TadE/TadG family type IV pilus assembly protein n=1 Tax=Phenylobacterium sp. TaxID=1871053 RepID=UPI002734D297|nr:TadE/TadG family type IV pilus assembly protein [Phenylobacterium sp.]MDP3855655.1 pilus assembly protein [Phenylobacterium sp.]